MARSAWPAWFRRWQGGFYKSRAWLATRDAVRDERRMRCEECGRLIRGKSIVDHVVEVTPDNYQDPEVTLGRGNLRLLCLECHNKKTFAGRIDFDLRNRKDVNLF